MADRDLPRLQHIIDLFEQFFAFFRAEFHPRGLGDEVAGRRRA
jgi:hypothetical protein